MFHTTIESTGFFFKLRLFTQWALEPNILYLYYTCNCCCNSLIWWSHHLSSFMRIISGFGWKKPIKCDASLLFCLFVFCFILFFIFFIQIWVCSVCKNKKKIFLTDFFISFFLLTYLQKPNSFVNVKPKRLFPVS